MHLQHHFLKEMGVGEAHLGHMPALGTLEECVQRRQTRVGEVTQTCQLPEDSRHAGTVPQAEREPKKAGPIPQMTYHEAFRKII